MVLFPLPLQETEEFFLLLKKNVYLVILREREREREGQREREREKERESQVGSVLTGQSLTWDSFSQTMTT